MTVYTLAVWTTVEGREDDFVALWEELADWTSAVFPEARGTLVRDRERPSRFVSFGPWASVEQVEAWRGAPEFEAIARRMSEVLVSFEPGTYDVVTEVGG